MGVAPRQSDHRSAGAAPQRTVPRRYTALDAARGFVMIYLVSDGFGLSHLKGGPTALRVASWFDHRPWDGFVAWELVMPAFVFMVGASMPFSLSRRAERGATFAQNLRHYAWRAVKLALLAALLDSLSAGHYFADPVATLTQLGLSCLGAFLILQLKPAGQIAAAAGAMALNWGLYVLFPGPKGPFDPTACVGIRIDHALFGIDHMYYWQTINFIGSSVTVLFGAWTAILIRSSRARPEKMKILGGAGAASLVAGVALATVEPIIHKCWTASYTFVHTGCVLLMILTFVWLFDGDRRPRLAFPFIVVGMNSIFIYMLDEAMKGRWLDPSVAVFTRRFDFLGMAGPVAQAWAVVAVMWGVCLWLYRRRVFFKV